MYSSIERLEQLIAGLQMFLEFLKAHPLIAERLCVPTKTFQIGFYGKDNRKNFSRFARQLVGGKGKLNKEYTDYSCKVTRLFNSMVNVEVAISRDAVCERVVVETIKHPEQVIAAYTEEKIEWKCR